MHQDILSCIWGTCFGRCPYAKSISICICLQSTPIAGELGRRGHSFPQRNKIAGGQSDGLVCNPVTHWLTGWSLQLYLLMYLLICIFTIQFIHIFFGASCVFFVYVQLFYLWSISVEYNQFIFNPYSNYLFYIST